MIRSFLTAAVLLGMATFASAAPMLYVSLQYIGDYSSSFAALGKATNTQTVKADGTTLTTVDLAPNAMYHAFDMYVSVSGLAAGQDVMYMQYGVVPANGASFFSYMASKPTITPPFMGDSQAPASTAFCQNVFKIATQTFVHDVSTGAGTADPPYPFGSGDTFGDYGAYLQLGEAAPYKVGTLYLKETVAGGTFAFNFASNPGMFKLINNNANGAAIGTPLDPVTQTPVSESWPADYSGKGDSVQFGSVPVPEPSTMALLVTGVLGLVCCWRNWK